MLTCALAAVFIIAAAEESDPCVCVPPSLLPNPEIASILQRIFEEWPGPLVSELEAKQKLSAFIDEARQVANSEDILLKNYFLHYFGEMPTIRNEERPVQYLVLLQLIAPSRENYLNALYPYLCSRDEDTLLWARRFMSATYKWTESSDVNLDPHAALILQAIQKGDPVPVGLVRDMFQRYPCHALGVLSKAEPELMRVRQILDWHLAEPACNENEAEFSIKDSQKIAVELELLVQSEKWWVRLWVVELLRQVPALRTESVWNMLQEDGCDVVRERTKAPLISHSSSPLYLHHGKSPNEQEP